MKRRDFLKLSTTALALPELGVAGEQVAKSRTASTTQAPASGAIEYPRTFSGRQLANISFPIGGVGTGSIGLGGRGQLRDWEIFNRPDKGNSPQYAFASIWAQAGKRKPDIRVLESRILPPYEGFMGLGFANVPGLPRLESAVFTGEFPFGWVQFHDSELPVQVSLEAFSPFIPLAADDSGLPLAVLRYRVSNPGAARARVSIAFSLDNPLGTTGRSNDYRENGRARGLLMRNPFLPAADPMTGSLAMAVVEPGAGIFTHLRGWASAKWWQGPLAFWDDFGKDGALGPEGTARGTAGSICLQREIDAGETADYTFLLAWHFPNRTPERCGWTAPKGHEKDVIGNYYCTRFADAWKVVEHAAERLPDLEGRTRKFVSAIRQTMLPDVVREAAMSNLSTLVTPTTFRTSDGVFHGFEGCADHVGCCYGSCTHVWNYEAAVPHLFPSLSRSLREQQFGFSTDAEGRMDFREWLPGGIGHSGIAAADGQMGTVIKLYLDWQLSGDTEWLRKLWPAAKRALEFAWIKGGWDEDRDGVMEGLQHNTYDVEFAGPNPLCEMWYLGALRAGEEMARAAGDAASAAEYRRLFDNGSRWVDANLFNGEYYIQQIKPIHPDNVAKGLQAGMGSADPDHPDFQMGDGCLVDQLVGQYAAEVAGLGLLLDPDHVQKTLQSIYKYNYKRSLFHHESVQRVFALNDEAGLVICDYSKGTRPETPFPYFSEFMTGFEYSAAILMLYRGMVAQGTECIHNIRARYDGEKRNPWNEAECGHHYARAMATWAAVLALSGFRYRGPEANVAIRPLTHARKFSSFWSAGTGWGLFTRASSRVETGVSLRVDGGTLRCRSLSVAAKVPGGAGSSATLGGDRLNHEIRHNGQDVTFTFANELSLKEGDELLLKLTPKSSRA